MTDDKNKECPLLRDTAFVDLMKRRIFNVLLIANPYDAFMLEDDGRVEEKIFDEYVKLGLRYPPRFFQVASQEEAEEELGKTTFDLIICMPGTDNNDVFDIARGIKTDNPTIPIVVLTPFSHGIRKSMENMDFSIFDYVFCWLGNTDLLLSIIKLIEDKMNLENDVAAGVQMIIVGRRLQSVFIPPSCPTSTGSCSNKAWNLPQRHLNAQLETIAHAWAA